VRNDTRAREVVRVQAERDGRAAALDAIKRGDLHFLGAGLVRHLRAICPRCLTRGSYSFVKRLCPACGAQRVPQASTGCDIHEETLPFNAAFNAMIEEHLRATVNPAFRAEDVLDEESRMQENDDDGIRQPPTNEQRVGGEATDREGELHGEIEAARVLEGCIEASRREGDVPSEAWALSALAGVWNAHGDPRHALALERQALALHERLPGPGVHAQPLIAVRDVRASSRFYQRLLGLEGLDGGSDHRDVYDRLLSGGRIVLQLHAWDAEEHPNLVGADAAPRGHGVLLWFETTDFDGAVRRARELGAEIVEEPHVNPAPGHREIWLRDPDGYVVVVASPDGEAA
jgi:catechol 2,3-dioxygenase-like lactoylglutathione lyase family enzyme